LSQEFITKIKSKNEEGLHYLYKNYSDALYGVIFRIVKDDFVAQNVLQKTFLKVWENISQFDDTKGTIFTWMSRIARNNAIDTVRLKSFKVQQKTESFDSLVHNNGTENIDISGLDVSKLLSKLDAKYRVILDKIYLEGYSHSALAEELDLPIGTVKSRLRIGIRTLRDELKGEKGIFVGAILLLLLAKLLFQWL